MGTAGSQGEIWGARARDWADVQERVAVPLYAAVLREAGVGGSTAALDIGCGAGTYCAMAAGVGAAVAGIDAAAPLVEIARERVPAGDFRAGEMEELPYADGAFDVVTGFNSFQFAARPVVALREASRVSRTGAVVVATFGKPDESESSAFVRAMGALAPAPPGAPGPFALSEDGALEQLAEAAGLTAGVVETVSCPWEYPDEPTALRGLLSSGPAVRATRLVGEAAVRAATVEVIATYRTPTGGVRLGNTFRYMIATA